MAFPTGWLRKCPLVIQHAQVPADQTSFPVLVTEVSLPSEMKTLGGAMAAQADGGDIRFSSDLAGASQLACEVVGWTQNANPALATAEIWVPVSILTASDVTIYVWYSAGGGQTQPAANAAFGSQAVWDANYKLVMHCANGSVLSVADSTSNANNGSGAALPSASAGQIDGGATLNGTTQFIVIPPTTISLASDLTVEIWQKKTAKAPTTNNDRFFSLITDANNFFQVVTDDTSAKYGAILTRGGVATIAGTSYGAYDTAAFHQIAYTVSGTAGVFYRDGVSVAAGAGIAVAAGATNAFNVGRRPDGTASTFFAGVLDEVRLSQSARTANWLATGFSNQNAPSAFLVAGTPVPTTTGATVEDRMKLGMAQLTVRDINLGGF